MAIQVDSVIMSLVDWAEENNLIHAEDKAYARNQLLRELHLEAIDENAAAGPQPFEELLGQLTSYMVEAGIVEDLLDKREQAKADLMNIFLPLPSEVQRIFEEKYRRDPAEATDYFYWLSRASNYIQMDRVAKNVHFPYVSSYGTVDITINLSKPEKDPRDIEAEKQKGASVSYPKCVLCKENEGYPGRIGHPARSNHRLIRTELEGETWYLQYSPYIYYPEHSILLSEYHRNMKINRATFTRLLGFVEQFPHYFMGSNADLPVVGGSILSHDHYQGGRYTFALEKAEPEAVFEAPAHSGLTIEIIHWPMSVLRLRSEDQTSVIEAAEVVRETWQDYTDTELGIEAYSNGEPHNTVTPIARKNGSAWEMDIVLRNNRKTEEHPYGLFHPHEEVHHIKKENIGLIEVMGLAVLPERLLGELEQVAAFAAGAAETVPGQHEAWAKELREQLQGRPEAEVRQGVEQGVGRKFMEVLHHAGVFKQTPEGRRGLRQFLQALPLKLKE
ncbi:galactose-1-phosphate uridylyltransferase [Marinococcus halophilus]|uniref:Galactose-1-phosphate uridylyltransferase n=1 Tax=Marinococcus halophilus TaxID=1371 RepID=A0A510Y889_MARHA|nr:UDP-glucose--hexose-1-phosphate uridylyltransferase [Marinococcus halophilus]OZT80557.1 galactose-1-phosphate uridylyltransferase [Marinococcus halophilus]GEK58911.1 galactose-1-phosphate uridylyltransferase [Marinococcus halophilus]